MIKSIMKKIEFMTKQSSSVFSKNVLSLSLFEIEYISNSSFSEKYFSVKYLYFLICPSSLLPFFWDKKYTNTLLESIILCILA